MEMSALRLSLRMFVAFRNFRLETLTWELLFLETFDWELWFGIVAWDLWLGTFGLESLSWDLGSRELGS